MCVENLEEQLASADQYISDLEDDVNRLEDLVAELRSKLDDVELMRAGDDADMEDMVSQFQDTLVFSLTLLKTGRDQEAADVIWQQLFELGFFYPQPQLH